MFNMAETDISIVQEKTQREKLSPAGDIGSFQDPKELEKLFKQHYPNLCRYSLGFVKLEEVAEEIVQDVFVSLWQKEEQLKVYSSVKAYLFTAVRNRSFNHLKSQFSRQKFESDSSFSQTLLTDNTQETLEYEELAKLLAEGIEKLPTQCRTIFEMSRLGGLSNQEIARDLKLSPKTIENQMGIGLKKLKEHLHTYWDVLLILLLIISQNEWIFLAK